MTVTRHRLPAPGVAAHGWDASPTPVVSREAPEVEHRQVTDRLKVIAFYGGRAGQRLDVDQACAGTGLPAARVLKALDDLTGYEFLQRAGMRKTAVGWSPTWTRLDPTEEDSG